MENLPPEFLRNIYSFLGEHPIAALIRKASSPSYEFIKKRWMSKSSLFYFRNLHEECAQIARILKEDGCSRWRIFEEDDIEVCIEEDYNEYRIRNIGHRIYDMRVIPNCEARFCEFGLSLAKRAVEEFFYAPGCKRTIWEDKGAIKGVLLNCFSGIGRFNQRWEEQMWLTDELEYCFYRNYDLCRLLPKNHPLFTMYDTEYFNSYDEYLLQEVQPFYDFEADTDSDDDASSTGMI